jgi:hypothetical protein
MGCLLGRNGERVKRGDAWIGKEARGEREGAKWEKEGTG